MNEDIILRNQGLVISIAKKFKDFGELDDIISEGNLALIRATKSFDESKGYKFSTFASKCIRNQIITYCELESGLSSYSSQQIRALNKVKSELERELEREPLTEELACELGVEIKRVETMLRIAQENLDVDDIKDFVPSETSLTDEIDEILLQDRIKEGLKILNPRERKIMELTMEGYKSGEMDLGVSEERIRQIKQEALNKLKHNYGL